MRNGKLGKSPVPATASAVLLQHMQAEECRWPRWMLPRRELEKWSRERRERDSSGSHFFWPTFGEMTTIHSGCLTDLLPACPPAASSAGPSVVHSGLASICSLLPDRRLSAAETLSAPSFQLLSSSLLQVEDFSLALTPVRPSAHLLAGQTGPSDLLRIPLQPHLSLYPFVFFSKKKVFLQKSWLICRSTNTANYSAATDWLMLTSAFRCMRLLLKSLLPGEKKAIQSPWNELFLVLNCKYKQHFLSSGGKRCKCRRCTLMARVYLENQDSSTTTYI